MAMQRGPVSNRASPVGGRCGAEVGKRTAAEAREPLPLQRGEFGYGLGDGGREADADLPEWLHRPGSFIIVSDLFNTALRHTRLSDAELAMRCPRCRWETSLAARPISGRRQTTYTCPACRARLVDLVPRPTDPFAEAAGYALGGFDVQTGREHPLSRGGVAEVKAEVVMSHSGMPARRCASFRRTLST
jgi:transposase-like protein